MRIIFKIIMAGVVPLLSAGCGPKRVPNTENRSPAPQKTEAARQAVSLERQLREARQQRDQLARALQQSKKDRDKMEFAKNESVNRWRAATVLFGGGSIVALGFGAALGSRARHDGTAQ